jgi:molybdenum cofactor cytidylyltransferase
MRCVPALDRVIVVLGHAAEEIAAAVDLTGATVVIAPDWDEGQSASLKRGVAAAAGADAVAITLGDQPLITPEVIAGALDQLPGHDAVRALYGGRPGHPVVFSRPVMDAVADLSGDTGARDLLARFTVAKWEAGHLCSAADVDTQEELAQL